LKEEVQENGANCSRDYKETAPTVLIRNSKNCCA